MRKYFSSLCAALVLSIGITQANANEVCGNPDDPLVAKVDGFSPHAGIAAKAHQRKIWSVCAGILTDRR